VCAQSWEVVFVLGRAPGGGGDSLCLLTALSSQPLLPSWHIWNPRLLESESGEVGCSPWQRAQPNLTGPAVFHISLVPWSPPCPAPLSPSLPIWSAHLATTSA
jgi:hypothetical protein